MSESVPVVSTPDAGLGGHHHGLSHAAQTRQASTTSLTSRLVVIVLLALVFAATVAGVVRLWPKADAISVVRQQASSIAFGPGVTMQDAVVLDTSPLTTGPSRNDANLPSISLNVRVETGPDKGRSVTVQAGGNVAKSGVGPGTRVQLMRLPDTAQTGNQYSYVGTHRSAPVILFTLVLVVAVIAVARWKGVMSLVGLAVAMGVIGVFMLPALATSDQGILVGLVGSGVIMFVVVHVAHGFSMRTAAALLSTALGLAMVAGLGVAAARLGYLSGFVDDDTFALASLAPTVDLKQLWVAATILAGLGVLNDVTITQASAVWELRIAAPAMTRRQVYQSAMRIGRDHIASTIYTIVFAYTGAALATAIAMVMFYRANSGSVLIYESFAAEILRILASSTALVLSVPITTAISALMIRGANTGDSA